jgi:hypothetical protein
MIKNLRRQGPAVTKTTDSCRHSSHLSSSCQEKSKLRDITTRNLLILNG